MAPNVNFKIYPKEVYDKFFIEIKGLSPLLPPKEIMEKFAEKFNFPITFGQEVSEKSKESFTIYRLRVPKDNEIVKEEQIDAFSYPPPENCPLQRCSGKGQQVFYGSGDPHTPFHELAKRDITQEKSIGYLSKWKIKPGAESFLMQNMFYGLSEEGEDYSAVFASATNQKIRDFLTRLPVEAQELVMYYLQKYQELFTSDESHYYLTSAIVDHIFTVFNKHKAANCEILLDMPIVSYPSVAKDKKAINFVIRKDFVDEYLELQSVEKVLINEINDEYIGYSGISRGVVKDGKVSWSKCAIRINPRVHDWGVLCEDKKPTNKYMKVSADARVLAKSNGEEVSINEYLVKKNINEAYWANMVKQMPQDENFDFTQLIPNNIEQVVLIPTEEEIFINKNKSEEKKIEFLGIPISYSIGYFDN